MRGTIAGHGSTSSCPQYSLDRVNTLSSQNHDPDLLRRLEPSTGWLGELMAQGGAVVPAGPFRLLYAPDALGLNYAFPAEESASEDDVPAGLASLRRLCADRGIPLRL